MLLYKYNQTLYNVKLNITGNRGQNTLVGQNACYCYKLTGLSSTAWSEEMFPMFLNDFPRFTNNCRWCKNIPMFKKMFFSNGC